MSSTATTLIVLSLVMLLLLVVSVFVPGDIAVLLVVSLALVLVVAIATYYTVKVGYASIRLIVVGTALILGGVATWYFGDALGTYAAVWVGIVAIIAGVIVWLLGDDRGGALNKRVAKYMEDIRSTKENG